MSYTLVVTVRDEVTGESDSVSVAFSVAGATASPAEGDRW